MQDIASGIFLAWFVENHGNNDSRNSAIEFFNGNISNRSHSSSYRQADKWMISVNSIVEELWHTPHLSVYISHHHMIFIWVLGLHILQCIEIAIINIDISSNCEVKHIPFTISPVKHSSIHLCCM